jgi:hypothetical protein
MLPLAPFAMAAYSNGSTMQDDKDKREGQTENASKKSKADPAADQRQDRLKLALRENLKRRKSQARGRSDASVAPFNGDAALPYDGNGKKPNG